MAGVLAGPTALAIPAIAGCTTVEVASAWSPCAPVPYPVQEVYGARWGGKVLIAGGMAPNETGTNALARAALYDPASDTWEEIAPLPFARHHPVCANADVTPSGAGQADTVCVIGGFRIVEAGSWSAVRDVQIFDGAWRNGAPMPQHQNEAVALGLAGKVHVISGRSPRGSANAGYRDHGDTNLHQVYDPGADSWQTAAPCPTARNSASGGVIDGMLYVAAGRTLTGGNTGALERYDPVSDTWEELRPMPAGAGGCAAGVMNGRLYVFGGEGGPRANGYGGVIPECWSYDPSTDAWQAEAPMGIPRHGLAGVAVEDRIYAVGGGTRPSGGSVSDAVEVLIA